MDERDESDRQARLIVNAFALAQSMDWLAGEEDDLTTRIASPLREAAKREAELREEIEVGLQLTGSFFDALKPLQLQAINVGNPGQHVTDLITERDDLRREVERLTYELLVIGDMAVVDFDDAGVGRVDAAVKPPATYAEARRAELEHVAALKAKVDRLQSIQWVAAEFGKDMVSMQRNRDAWREYAYADVEIEPPDDFTDGNKANRPQTEIQRLRAELAALKAKLADEHNEAEHYRLEALMGGKSDG